MIHEIQPDVVANAFSLSLRRQKQEDLSKIKDILVYIASSGSAWATGRPCLINQNKTKNYMHYRKQKEILSI